MGNKKWTAVSLALALCIAGALPATALEDTSPCPQEIQADIAGPQTEAIPDAADAESADPGLIIPESFEAETEILAPEPSETPGEELTIDFVEVVDDPAGEGTPAAAEPPGTASDILQQSYFFA